MNIERHIQSLLYKHECVVVPGFGAFLTNYIPAQSNKNNTLLHPPKKQLTFNASLSLNDGILAAFVAQENNISTEQSLALINERVGHYKQLLNKYGKFNIEEIGLLYKQDNRLMFEPDRAANFLLSGFGLESVVLPTPAHAIAQQTTTGSRWYWAAAVALPLVGVALWWSLGNNQTGAYSNLNPFSQIETSYEARPTTANIVPATENILEEPEVSTSIKLDDNALRAIPIKKEAIETVTSVKQFHIIAGCFKELENAQALILELNAKGFNDAAIVDEHRGLHRVAFASFQSDADARKALKNVKRQVAKEAWLLRK